MYINNIAAKDCNYNYFIFAIIFFLIILPYININYAKLIITFFNLLYFFSFFIKICFFVYGYLLYDNPDYYSKIKINIINYPIYSILLPLYKEKFKTIRTLLNALNKLDYPKNKLDIKLIVEDGDFKTIEAAQKLQTKFNFDMIIVPDNLPKTKPKACNYALKYTKGEYITIYDAEDKPEKYQLKKVINKFAEYPKEYICMQASLNYYNKTENLLTKCFSVEYSLWFDFTIRALEKLGLFFPLGGTSNHFKRDKLLEIGGWDAYNVTEDADLGVRIARQGYKIGIVNSITNEECPIHLTNWLRQRSRWIKGFIQTYCVHMQNPKKLFQDLRWQNFIIFQIFVGMSSIFFISLPIILFFNFLEINYLNFLSKLNFYLMLYGMLLSFCLVIYKNKLFKIASIIIFFPFYWFLHSIASLKALLQIIAKPFYWEKTEHGVSKTIIN
jgi:glycosyltransferase XagB